MGIITGIYKITNKINGKCYIGQSVNIKRRWWNHKCCNGSDDFPLYKAIKKYGINNFTFEVLEECSKEDLSQRELYYINKYDSVKKGYNPTNITDNPFKHKETFVKCHETWIKRYKGNKEYLAKLSKNTKELWKSENYRKKVIEAINSKESLEKISKVAKEMWQNETVRNKITKASKDRANTKEFKEQKSKEIKEAWSRGCYSSEQSAKNLSKFWDKFNSDEEYKRSIIQKYKNNRPNAIAIEMLDISTEKVIKYFDKLMDGAAWIRENTCFIKADYSTINKVCKGRGKTAYGYKWRFKK